MIRFQRRRAGVSGVDMAFIEEGDPENPAVVFLHGFPTSSFLWREFVPLFAPWTHVIAPDLLGCGGSGMPEEGELHIRAQAGYTRELLAGLGVDGFAVVGHGHGGGIAQLLALDGGVGAMVLVDSIAFDAWPSETTKALQRLAPRERGQDVVRGAFEAFLDQAMAKPERRTDDLRDAYLAPFLGEEGVRAFFRGIDAADGLGLTGREDELATLSCPTLILWGEEDPYLSVEVGERLNDAIPTS
ncbi:MAG TPA: alpha/beta hydrolase, partial [Actinomycetota bacterium]|nr:alpha/beta hydrolase [Actinomycetota bacterium]